MRPKSWTLCNMLSKCVLKLLCSLVIVGGRVNCVWIMVCLNLHPICFRNTYVELYIVGLCHFSPKDTGIHLGHVIAPTWECMLYNYFHYVDMHSVYNVHHLPDTNWTTHDFSFGNKIRKCGNCLVVSFWEHMCVNLLFQLQYELLYIVYNYLHCVAICTHFTMYIAL